MRTASRGVVGAEREAVHQVLHLAVGGEHQDARLRLLAMDGLADRVAVQLGQVAVEHEHVVVARARLGERARPLDVLRDKNAQSAEP